MKINPADRNEQPVIDINELSYELGLQHPEVSEVFTIKIDDDVFIYKPLCRKLYKTLMQADISPLEKEELLCQECVLWPENYNFDECDAGLPTKLAEAILKNSYVDSLEMRQNIINLYRQDMYDVDNQVTCLIHEAFPEFSIDEIETWDMRKTAEYCSKAEWILANLRGAQYTHDPFTGRSFEELEQDKKKAEESQVSTNVQTNEVTTEVPDKDTIGQEMIKSGQFETIEERQKRLKLTKQKITPEQLAELREKYPEMQWDSSVFEDPNFDDMAGSVDTTAPALRPGW